MAVTFAGRVKRPDRRVPYAADDHSSRHRQQCAPRRRLRRRTLRWCQRQPLAGAYRRNRAETERSRDRWASSGLLRHDTFSGCVLEAVNLGEDTDTTGAVAGGLAGTCLRRGRYSSRVGQCPGTLWGMCASWLASLPGRRVTESLTADRDRLRRLRPEAGTISPCVRPRVRSAAR
ncbi:MAG: ADP-ribosylglycohydrolase family protein [Caldilineales bacterium]